MGSDVETVQPKIQEIRTRLEAGLAQVDPHKRLSSAKVSYNVVSGSTLEISFSQVARIDEAEVLGVKKLVGKECFCRVKPESADSLLVKFVVPLI
ncbi:MAG: hypothetical protein OEZ54_03970 [Gemmatimonadota bacterium]|nr:hypothetical protein [Gemmatimonadota bacterium]